MPCCPSTSISDIGKNVNSLKRPGSYFLTKHRVKWGGTDQSFLFKNDRLSPMIGFTPVYSSTRSKIFYHSLYLYE